MKNLIVECFETAFTLYLHINFVYSIFQEHYGFRNNIPGLSNGSPLARKSRDRNQDSYQSPKQPYRNKRPVTIQRSHSFQHATTHDPLISEDITKDSASMENLAHTDGPPIRTRSFRMATRLSPIRLEAGDETDSKLDNTKVPVDNVLVVKSGNENIPPALRKTIEEEMKKLDRIPHKFGTLTFKKDKENEIEDQSLRKRGRYSSMPALNCESQNSPKVSRLHSERSGYSPIINRTGVSQTREINLKNYFNWSRDRLNNSLSEKDSNKENISSNLSREAKPVLAFHDVFSNLKKSSENLNSKTGPPVNLTKPKPFSSTLTISASQLGSHAKLDKWKNGEKFTKGSIIDVSHLKEDPWIPNKIRSSTESKIHVPYPSLVPELSDLHASHQKDCSYKDKLLKAQKNRLSLDESSGRHSRTQSFTGDDRAFSRDNLDWLVYANRNSLPVSGFSTEDIIHNKYCTPPRGSMVPPSAHGSGPYGKEPLPENVISAYAILPSRNDLTGPRVNGFGQNGIPNGATTDSSVSLSATTTSSETCSSPDIMKDSVFDDAFSPEKFFGPENSGFHRSLSSTEGKRTNKFCKGFSDERPSSMDILDVDHLDASDKLLAEMEHYMKHSSSSSSSLNSNNNKFPKSIPTFTHTEKEHRKRDSVISSGSASSYESAKEDLESEHDETIVETLKSKFHNIAARFGGKKLNTDIGTKNSTEHSNPSSPIKYKSEDQTVKVSPLSHNLSLRAKPHHPKSPEPDLPSLLLESQPGSEAIGSRMANPDFDDYATFSLPRNQIIQSGAEINKPNEKRRSEMYFRPTTSLSGLKSVSQSALGSKYSPVTSLRNLHIQQSDSAFSIQSADIDGSTPSESPRSENDTDNVRNNETEIADNFYEKRLSIALNSDEVFRDSAVYCDDTDTPVASPRDVNVPTKVPIKEYVQQLEEKNKHPNPSPVKVKHREPGMIIKQRLESLQANLENQASCSTSRSMSAATSRTQSRDTSRAPSEEKQTDRAVALKEFIDTKFPVGRTLSIPVDSSEKFSDDSELFRSRSNTSSGKLKPAFSLGRLDQLSSDVENLVIMKGWVRQLIDKFQAEK